jgi:hypothetical protein
MVAVPTQPSLVQRIAPHEEALTFLARRQFLMEAFTDDLDRVTRLRPFHNRNESIWTMMLDSREMLVIHLASWFKGALENGGLIGQLQINHVADLPRAPPHEDPNPNRPEWLERDEQEDRKRWHSDSFNRLFPKAGSHPNGPDFDDLRQRVRDQAQPLKDDRNWNRAHPFETVSGATKMLNVVELRSHLTYAEELMNDIRTVGGHGKFHYEEANVPSAATVAPDLVDAMLIGNPERLLRLRGSFRRDEFYNRLHADHDAKPPENDDLFNDVFLPLRSGSG